MHHTGMIRALSLLFALTLAACGSAPAPSVAPATYGQPAPRLNFADTAPHDFGFRAPQDHPVHGIDASRHQPQIDWRTARANGVTFAWLKATEGGDILDPAFRDNWRAARRAGVAHGAYHFFYHCRPAAEQARWFIRHVPREAGSLPPVLDLEWTPFSPTCTIRRSGAVIRSEARIFLQAIEAHYGKRPVIYTSVDFYRDTQLWRVGPYDFWLRSVAAHPDELYGGRPWTFWQYSATGAVPGVPGEVDLNAFNGSASQWQAWLAANAG